MLNVVRMAVGQMVTLVLSIPIKMHIIFSLVYGSQSSELLCYQELKLLLTYGSRIGLVEKCKVTLEGR